jgi:hypothetical protein
MRSKAEVMAELRTMLRDVLAAAAGGTRHARVARAHGYVDGYMRALLDLDVATRSELIEVVAAERERLSGPAVRVLEPSSAEEASSAMPTPVRLTA